MMLKRRGLGAAFSISPYEKASAPSESGTSAAAATAELAFRSGSAAAVKEKYPSWGLRNQINNDINNLEDALRLYDDMVRTRPLNNVIPLNQLLSRLIKLKHYSSAISLFKDMWALGIPVNEYILTTVVTCYCLVGRVDLGFCTLGAFFKRGVVPNVATFAILLNGLFRWDRVSQAQELFKKIIYRKLCEPDEKMYGVIIDGLCKAGNTSMAIEFLEVYAKTKS